MIDAIVAEAEAQGFVAWQTISGVWFLSRDGDTFSLGRLPDTPQRWAVFLRHVRGAGVRLPND